MILFLLSACGADEEGKVSIFDTVMSDYHGLTDGASWTYRDDSPENIESELPEEFNLLRVHHETQGVMTIRRGSRWVDASDAGEIIWSSDDGLTLESWSLPGGLNGSGPLQVASERPDDNPEIEDGDSRCTTLELSDHETWFGVFDQALQIDCIGGPFEGRLVFGKRVGVIQLQVDDYGLDLVAPW